MVEGVAGAVILLLTGASHTGKTALAQKLLRKHHYPYLSIDHLKMGLIRAGYTNLTPQSSDEALTNYLWPVVREMIKTAIENKQDLIVEGCYIPPDWKNDFTAEYLKEIRFCCLIFSENYILSHFDDIMHYANAAENRIEDDFSIEIALKDNAKMRALCGKYGLPYILIDQKYPEDLDI